MRGATIRHMTLAVGLVLLLLTLRSQPAAAHSTNGSDATYYRTRLDGLSPPVAGLTATVDPRGEWIQVTNATGKTLTILGYAHPSRSSPSRPWVRGQEARWQGRPRRIRPRLAFECLAGKAGDAAELAPRTALQPLVQLSGLVRRPAVRHVLLSTWSVSSSGCSL